MMSAVVYGICTFTAFDGSTSEDLRGRWCRGRACCCDIGVGVGVARGGVARGSGSCSAVAGVVQGGAPASIEEVCVGCAACGLEESCDDRLLNTIGLEEKEACSMGPDGEWGWGGRGKNRVRSSMKHLSMP